MESFVVQPPRFYFCRKETETSRETLFVIICSSNSNTIRHHHPLHPPHPIRIHATSIVGLQLRRGAPQLLILDLMLVVFTASEESWDQ